MLVLTREKNQEIVIRVAGGHQITVSVVEIRGNRVRLGFVPNTDDRHVIAINRSEVQNAIDHGVPQQLAVRN